MTDLLTLAGITASGKFLLTEVLGDLAKEALEDYVKDFLKDSLSETLAMSAPLPLKKAVAESLKAFLELFQDELEYNGLPGALIHHEYAKPLKRLLKDREIKQFLGRAFEHDVKRLEGDVLQAKWQSMAAPKLPEGFDWAQLAKQYVRQVKGLIRGDDTLRQLLELHYQEQQRETLDEILGVPVSFDLKQYQETLREKFGQIKLESLDTTGSAYNDLRLWNIFVAQNVRECEAFTQQLYELPKAQLLQLQAQGEIDALLALDALESQRKTYLERPIEPVFEVVGPETSSRQVVILGDPGSGKSTLLQYMALDWAEKPLSALKHQPIPILIELRLYAQDKQAKNCNDFLEYYHQGNTACRLNQRALHELLQSGNAIALFDGIDEVFEPTLREAVVNDIHRFSNCYPSLQIIVTSRWLGYKAETLRNAGFRHFMLQDLDDQQITDFIERWHHLTFREAQAAERIRKRDRLQRAIHDSKAIHELAGNPLLLTMMAILNRTQELPRDRARLYDRASEVLLHQWDVEAKLLENTQLQHWSIDVRDKQAMLRKVAYHMQASTEGSAGNVISRADLEKILTDYLKTIEVEQARAVAKVMIEQLRARNFILCSLGADCYAFVHRTFLEYFCAAEIVWQFEKERKYEVSHLKKNIYGQHFQEEAWDEVLRLIAGLIDPRFVGEIIDYLMEQKLDYLDFCRRTYEFFSIIDGTIAFGLNLYLPKTGMSHLILAAHCLIEVRNRHEVGNCDGLLLQLLQQSVLQQHPYSLADETIATILGLIALVWPHPATLDWLKDRAQNDDHSDVRSSAVQELAQGWKNDPNTLTLLKRPGIAKQ
ncbi:MAG: NACHT domain-containing protein, partial [Phormidesmis sp. RL_2_1]|nr:NACHT domain-containing protein [Phormidesmis sp. RL_2_1]